MPSTNGHGQKTTVLYCRVSTDEQARSGYSLAQQLEALRQYADREGYEVLEEVTDPGQSGASLERPGLDRVRDLVADGGVGVVLAQDRDRFAREPAYLYLLRQEFGEYGTKIRALNDRGDDSPEGELMDGVFDQFAKFERAKTAERTRRGKLRKAREGRIVHTKRTRFGFKANADGTGYEVDEEKMAVVRRIFHMVGLEKVGIRAVIRTFKKEGVPSPTGKRIWAHDIVRRILLEDSYKPHTFDELKEILSESVLATLDPAKVYGVYYFNREKITRRQVAEETPEGRIYRKKSKRTIKDRSEWIAIPVPDAGIPREVVDETRWVLRENKRCSKADNRFWELSGGILRCGYCGRAMVAQVNSYKRKDGQKSRYYYLRCPKAATDPELCPNRKSYRADALEAQVWEAASKALKDPEHLRVGLDEMIKQKRNALRGDPEHEARAWLEKLAEVDEQRSRAQDLAIEGLLDHDELRAKLAALEETRETAQRELEALRGRQEEIEELERDRDALMEHYAEMVPEDLDTLAPEQRHHLYKLLKLSAIMHTDGTPELRWALRRDLELCKTKPTPLV